MIVQSNHRRFLIPVVSVTLWPRGLTSFRPLRFAWILLIAVLGPVAPLAEGQTDSGRDSRESGLRLYAIRGHVFLEGTREPLEGFRVYLYQKWTELGQAVTDGNGYFEFGLLRIEPSEVRVLARPPLEVYTVAPQTLELEAEGGDVEVTLFAECVFDADFISDLIWEGRVFQWDGSSAVEGASVLLSRGELTLQEARTDGRGFFKFHLRDLPSGFYQLSVNTENDLLQAATASIKLGERDLYKNESVVLGSPYAVPLRRVTILGRVIGSHGSTWAASGAEVQFVTGEYVTGRTTVGEGGHFHREKLYAPAGPMLVNVLPNFGLLRPAQKVLHVPAPGPTVPTVRIEVNLSPTTAWWAGLVLVPLVGGACLWAVLRFWVLPEWRAVRAEMFSSSLDTAESGLPNPGNPQEKRGRAVESASRPGK
jgi:hypothetical protein